MTLINDINNSFFSIIEYIPNARFSAKDCYLIYNANLWHRYYYPYFGNKKIDTEVSKATNVTVNMWPNCDLTLGLTDTKGCNLPTTPN